MNFKPGNPYYDTINHLLKQTFGEQDYSILINQILNSLFTPHNTGIDTVGDEWDTQ